MSKLIVAAAFLALVFSPLSDADAASKKKQRSRADYTKAEQKKFFDDALGLCRKKFGARLHSVKVDYKKFQYVCRYY